MLMPPCVIIPGRNRGSPALRASWATLRIVLANSYYFLRLLSSPARNMERTSIEDAVAWRREVASPTCRSCLL